MVVGRTGETATLLQDGRVLIVGGADASGKSVAQAELYDPRSGAFSLTGSLAAARFNATASLLQDGRVLITSGEDGPSNPVVTLDELYDPKTGTFSSTGRMTTDRYGLTATVLLDGRVLIAGSATPEQSVALSSAELYDPTTGRFTPTGSMEVPRAFGSATLLPDGRVLVTGGTDYAHLNLSAELYDPGTGTFGPAGSMVVKRITSDYTQTLLPDGRVLIAGGWGLDANGYPYVTSSAELYDPSTGTFSPTGDMSTVRPGTVPVGPGAAAVLMADGRVLIAGGGEGLDAVGSAELYDPSTGTFTSTGSMIGFPRIQTATLLNDGRVLITGATQPPYGPGEISELYNP